MIMRHKWNESDLEILENNIKSLGFTKGCKKTSKQLGISDKSCRSMYSAKRFKKYTEHAIPVTHPEKLENISIVENKNRKITHTPWTPEEIEALKANIIRFGSGKGCKRTAELTGRTCMACRDKARKMNIDGFGKDYKRLNKDQENELTEFFKKRIAENPNNLTAIFREAETELGIPLGTVTNRWYGNKGYEHKPSCRNNIGPLFTLVGATATVNGKNQSEPTTKKTKWIFTIFKKWFNKKKK